MVENNVKENLLDDEEEIYVNLNDLVNLRESVELKEAADALERALGDLPVDEAGKNRIARLSAELMAQAEQYAVELGIQAYLEFTRTLSPEMNAELEGHKDNEVPET